LKASSAKDIAAFSSQTVLPLLDTGFSVFARRDLARSRGPFVQALLFAQKRSGWLQVLPTFYVLGAVPSDEVLFQTMSVPVSGIDKDRQWLVRGDLALDANLAERLAAQLAVSSPVSFFEPLEDNTIGAAIDLYTRRSPLYHASISRAFMSMCMGSRSSAAHLAAAHASFIKRSRYGKGGEPYDFEQALLARLEVLRQRLSDPAGLLMCREEAEVHALRLGLPKLHWPPEWPTVSRSPTTVERGWLSTWIATRSGRQPWL
jgi:hypothetical protein